MAGVSLERGTTVEPYAGRIVADQGLFKASLLGLMLHAADSETMEDNEPARSTHPEIRDQV